jgi:hypothetical protein
MVCPDLKRLPILPLAEKCADCEYYYSCPVTSILHNAKFQGVALTYQKLVALMIASGSRPNTTAERIIEKISTARNVVFDEIHEIQYGRTESICVYDNEKNVDKWLKLEKFVPAADDFKEIRKVVSNFYLLVQDDTIKNGIMLVYMDSIDPEFFKRKLSKTFKNSYSDLTEKEIVACYNEIITLTENRRKYGLSMDDILQIYKMMNILASEQIQINAIREGGEIKAMLTAVDKMFQDSIQSFIYSIQNKDKRIILTSATICSHDYKNLYFMPGTQIKDIMFGYQGDPMQTNRKMLILADTKNFGTIGRNSLYKKSTEVMDKIIRVLEMYGDDDCIIITMSIKEARLLQEGLKNCGHPHAVTYYKAPETMGVASNCRVMIAVGAAEKPSNAFDVLCETHDEALILREEAVHSDTWQAWSRVKDPAGVEPSLVFAFGCTYEKCVNFVTWGFGRMCDISNTEGDFRRCSAVNTSKEITKPQISRCAGFNDMVEKAVKHKQNKYSSSEILKNVPIYYSIGINLKISDEIYLPRELLFVLLSRTDVYAEQGINGSFFKVSAPITETLIDNHIAGKITIGAYTLDNKNMVRWVCFDIDAHRKEEDTEADYKKTVTRAENDLTKLRGTLDKADVPYILEASGTPHSYHIWVILKKIDAKTARAWGRAVIKAAGVKCEVYPKQTKLSRKGYGNLVKLPFATHRKTGNKSKIFIDGEFVENFEKLIIWEVDISGFVPEPDPDEEQEPVEAVIPGQARPIFNWAINQRLEGPEGHWMRIFIVREFYNSGIHDPAQLAKLFEKQTDYDFTKSLYHVNSIIQQRAGYIRTQTIKEMCPDLCALYIASGGKI